MSTPIPTILENAANVVRIASALPYNPHNKDIGKLKNAAKLVSAQDLQAVMNEIGMVYAKMASPLIYRIGTASDVKEKTLKIAVIMDYGMGQREIVISLPLEQAEVFSKGVSESIATLKLSSGGLITDVSNG